MCTRKDGLDPRCKLCARAAKRASSIRVKQADPLAYLKRRRRYVNTYKSNHPDKIDAYNHKRNLRRKFGMTVEQYEQLLTIQNGVCAICFQPPVTKRLAVDHDKETGQIRGLLCVNCNTAIGLLKHDIRNIDNAKTYLLNTI